MVVKAGSSHTENFAWVRLYVFLQYKIEILFTFLLKKSVKVFVLSQFSVDDNVFRYFLSQEILEVKFFSYFRSREILEVLVLKQLGKKFHQTITKCDVV